MTSLKNTARLAALAVPFALYAAWQVRSVVRSDGPDPPPPAEGGPPADRLAKDSARAGGWAAEARKAVKVAWQYQTADPGDRSPDPDVAAVVKAADARAADLADLDVFLGGVQSRGFGGRLKGTYEKWAEDRDKVKKAEEAFKEWQRAPLDFKTAADAARAAGAAKGLIDGYVAKSQFSNRGLAAGWRLEARGRVLDALVLLADRQYQAAVAARLPLDPGAGAEALAAAAGVKAQLAALGDELKQADGDRVPLDPAFRAALADRAAGAAEWTAREELLALFAQPDLFTNPTGAEDWLKKVAARYEKTKNAEVRRLIRTKVQEFAEAFVPRELRLDDQVLVKGEPVPRKDVLVSFSDGPGGPSKSEPLSNTADGLTEFNFRTARPHNTEVQAGARTEEPAALKPTEASKAAVAYNAARAGLSAGAAPRWTADSIGPLKMACAKLQNLIDQLRVPGAGAAGPVPKAGTRVLGLAAGMAACPELFDKGP